MSTKRVVGTYGYMPPEGFDHPDHNLNLIGHVWKSYNESNLMEVVDSVILQSSNQHEVYRAIQIGLLCVQEYPEDRPTMSSTFQMLTSYNELPTPKQPGFFSGRRNHRETEASSKSSTLNTISVSIFAPR
ncbi:Protein kinase domain-containing protein [Heracleum sosnowskyi]|uniref:Protein kinase domain-containing protein n=1 Tax=Heracleum sosnowskyi TaxID=360622 RepID=A0AAD8J0C3_9APIA|nr:Protein kinase domain-containing protein [Heracleum sosnowskyi]